MSNKIALVSLDFAGPGSVCSGNKGVVGDGRAISRSNNQDLSDRNSQPARQSRGNRARSRRLRRCGISREGPRSRTRHGATPVRGNNAAQCRKPDQPDRSTRLSGHFPSLLPAGACAFRGVAVVAAMMPHDKEDFMKLSDTQLMILSSASQRTDHAGVLPANLKGGAAKKVVDRLLNEKLLQELRAKDDMPVWRRGDDNRRYSLRITKAGLRAIEFAKAPDDSAAADPNEVAGLDVSTQARSNEGPGRAKRSRAKKTA